MAVYFLDTSAILKRHVQEAGTTWIRILTQVGAPHRIYLARITGVEVSSTISRRQRGGALPPAQAAAILRRFRRHLIHRYRIIEISPLLLSSAMALAEAHGLRGYDAVQLAAALDLKIDVSRRVGAA